MIKDFSIIIPTFNRSGLLKKAIASVLKQKEISFEIIVGDNNSPDDTKEVVEAFKDSRIRYFKNKRNLGFAGNIKKLFLKARGKYIFTLGDDDLILDEDTLSQVLQVMKKTKAGVGNIGTIYWIKSPKVPCKSFILSEKIILSKPRPDKKLPLKALDFNISFFSGLIFDHSVIDIKKITKSFTYAYFPFVFNAIQKKGIVYIPKVFLIGYISTRFVPQYYDIKTLGSFYMEDYLQMVKNFVSKGNYEKHKRDFLLDSAILLPSIKLFTNNENYIKVIKKLIIIDKTLLMKPKFIFLTIFGFLPKNILQLLRNFMIYLSEKKTIELVRKYDYLKKLDKLGI